MFLSAVHVINPTIRPVHTDPSPCPWPYTWYIERDEPENHISGTGASFVDVKLRIAMAGAADTILLHRSAEPHGTTVGGSAPGMHVQNTSVSITLTQ